MNPIEEEAQREWNSVRKMFDGRGAPVPPDADAVFKLGYAAGVLSRTKLALAATEEARALQERNDFLVEDIRYLIDLVANIEAGYAREHGWRFEQPS